MVYLLPTVMFRLGNLVYLLLAKMRSVGQIGLAFTHLKSLFGQFGSAFVNLNVFICETGVQHLPILISSFRQFVFSF